MVRMGFLVCVAICGIVAGCGGGPASASGCCASGPGGPVNMTFTPQDQTFAEAADAYRRLWADEGSKISEAMEQASGLTFIAKDITAVIFEGVSRAGDMNTPMYLRASYPADTKRSALVHELGHRLIAQLTNRPQGVDEHRVLDLFLYDVWENLWGKEFADQQVNVESARRGVYDYESAWKWALSLSTAERASRFADIVRSNRR